jgi:hypothetical protein
MVVTRTVELQKTKELSELDISILLLRYHNDVCQQVKEMSYQEELDKIVTYEPRNRFISKLTLDQSGNTLVMFQFVEKHGKVLYEMIKSMAEEGRKVFYVSGEVDATDREQIRGIVEKENDAIIVASLGTLVLVLTSAIFIILYLRHRPSLKSKYSNRLAVVFVSLMMVGLLDFLILLMIFILGITRTLH